jgi:hypothetical protein
MNPVPAEREQQRSALLQRIALDRSAISRTLRELRRPVQTLERWQRRATELLAAMPALLLGIAATWVLLRLLNRRSTGDDASNRSGSASTVIRRPRRAWLPLLQQLITCWRIALQLSALLRASVAATSTALPVGETPATSPPRRSAHEHQAVV